MKKMKKFAARLHKWNRVFCDGVTCKVNMKRDALIVLAVIILLGAFIGMDHYIYNKKIHNVKVASLQKKETSPEKELFIKAEIAQQENAVQVDSIQKSSDAPNQVEQLKPAVSVQAPKKIIRETKSTGLSCIKIPNNILPLIRNNPTPPDGKIKDGKLVCHVLADGHKDHPQKSSKNPKGSWGGCCYDPDEVPNPACCYPVGSVYERHLSKYFANPFPHKK